MLESEQYAVRIVEAGAFRCKEISVIEITESLDRGI